MPATLNCSSINSLSLTTWTLLLLHLHPSSHTCIPRLPVSINLHQPPSISINLHHPASSYIILHHPTSSPPPHLHRPTAPHHVEWTATPNSLGLHFYPRWLCCWAREVFRRRHKWKSGCSRTVILASHQEHPRHVDKTSMEHEEGGPVFRRPLHHPDEAGRWNGPQFPELCDHCHQREGCCGNPRSCISKTVWYVRYAAWKSHSVGLQQHWYCSCWECLHGRGGAASMGTKATLQGWRERTVSSIPVDPLLLQGWSLRLPPVLEPVCPASRPNTLTPTPPAVQLKW